ncbi:MAG: hypothetical protein IPF57_14230 [Gammaproteobacteria bacterium]|nr:hypothetical protein [Gammaproteobacteria bacterium]
MRKSTARRRRRVARPGHPSDTEPAPPRRVYVLNFHGDIRAQAVRTSAQEITALLTLASDPADRWSCVARERWERPFLKGLRHSAAREASAAFRSP